MIRNPRDWKSAGQWLFAVAEPTRLAIITVLSTGEKTVTELARACQSEVVNVSFHLGILRAAGVVEALKDGRFRRYSLIGVKVTASELELAHESGFRVSIPLN